MKINIKEVSARNVIARGIASQSYTLTRSPDLRLFEFSIIVSDEEAENTPDLCINDEYHFSTDPVEFWGISIHTARIDLQNNLRTFINSGAHKVSEMESGAINSREIMIWARAYYPGEGNLLNLVPGMCEHEIMKRVIDIDSHFCYVHKKMLQLYDHIDSYEIGRAWLAEL